MRIQKDRHYTVPVFHCTLLLGDLLVNRNLLSVTAKMLKTDSAVYKSEQGIILALADIGAGMDVSTTLTNQDVAGQNELTVCSLGAESLGLRVTTVLGRTHTFFMSEQLNVNFQHFVTPPYRFCR